MAAAASVPAPVVVTNVVPVQVAAPLPLPVTEQRPLKYMSVQSQMPSVMLPNPLPQFMADLTKYGKDGWRLVGLVESAQQVLTAVLALEA
ncbi:MAG TPA: hypothetical protein VN776_16695 [Terracidiphilus sp.]|nr:hypothetical protein [Terracidiphilus sp.]